MTPEHTDTGTQAELAALRQRVADLEQEVAANRHERETIFQAMFSHNSAVKLLIDPQTGAIVDANPAASDFYGYPQSVLRTMHITDVNTLSPDQVQIEMQRAQAEQRRYFLFQHRLASGDIRDVAVYSGPVQIEGRSLLFSIIHDISGRKKAEAALRESEERYRIVADWTYDWEYWLDASGQYRYVSPACTRITGYPPEAFLTVPTMLERITHPEDREMVANHLQAEIHTRAAHELTFRIITHAGEERWISHACNPVYAADGQWLGQRASNRDITTRVQVEEALRQSEQRYREVVEGTDNLITQVDEQGRFIYLNHAANRIYGLSPAECIGRSGFDFVHPEDQEGTFTAFASWLEHRETSVTFENRQVSRTGEVYVMLWTVNLHYDRAGKITMINSIGQDISDLRRTQEELRQARDELEQRVAERTAELHQANQVLQAEIMEHQRTADALRESQALFQSFLDNAPMLIFARDRQGRYIFVNHAYEATVKRPVTDIVGKTPDDILPPESAQQFLAQDQHTLATGNTTADESRITLYDRMYVYLKHKFPLYDTHGAIYAVGGISTDISERKRMEEALQESEARYRRLTENAQDIIYRIQMHPVRQFEYVSPAATTITGYTPEEHYADPDLGFKLVHPDDMPILTSLVQGHILRDTPIELRYIHKSGSLVWIEQRNVPIYDEADNLIAIEGIARNITRRKQAEQNLAAEWAGIEAQVVERTRALKHERDRTRAILEALGEAVMVVTLDDIIEYLNPAAVALTGFQPDADTPQEQPWWRWQLVDPQESIIQIEEAIQTGQSWRGEVVLRRIDGDCYDAALTVAPLFDPESPAQPVGFVSVQRNITAMKTAERLKDQFVSNVSHELRSPMSLITLLTGSLELLYHQMDDSRRIAIIGDIRKHAQTLSELINDVLEISRIDSGRIAEVQHPLDLAQLVRDEVEQLRPIARKKAIGVGLELDETLPVVGQAGQVRQIIRNLMNNAIKYTPDGGQISCTCRVITSPVPRIRSRRTPDTPGEWPGSDKLPTGRWVAVRISDSGIGINPADLPHIFERFYRAQSQGDIPGTGLGLSIAWELAKHHGGYLAVHSTPGRGSSFALYLPHREEAHDI